MVYGLVSLTLHSLKAISSLCNAMLSEQNEGLIMPNIVGVVCQMGSACKCKCISLVLGLPHSVRQISQYTSQVLELSRIQSHFGRHMKGLPDTSLHGWQRDSF